MRPAPPGPSVRLVSGDRAFGRGNGGRNGGAPDAASIRWSIPASSGGLRSTVSPVEIGLYLDVYLQLGPLSPLLLSFGARPFDSRGRVGLPA